MAEQTKKKRNYTKIPVKNGIWYAYYGGFSAEFIREMLEKGYSIHTHAQSMPNGHHRWYIEKGEMKCFGSGENWRDMNADTLHSIETACQYLSELSAKQEVLWNYD